jgi:hypothetical protein
MKARAGHGWYAPVGCGGADRASPDRLSISWCVVAGETRRFLPVVSGTSCRVGPSWVAFGCYAIGTRSTLAVTTWQQYNGGSQRWTVLLGINPRRRERKGEMSNPPLLEKALGTDAFAGGWLFI